MIEPSVDNDSLIEILSEKLAPLREQDPVVLHIDTAGVSLRPHGVPSACAGCNSFVFSLMVQLRSGLEELLFHLLILGCLSGSRGLLWRRNKAHLIAVEVLKTPTSPQSQSKEVPASFKRKMLY